MPDEPLPSIDVRRTRIHRTRRLLLLAAIPLLASCARPRLLAPSVPKALSVTVSRELAYAHDADAVRQAYRAAMEEAGLRVENDVAGGLRARTQLVDSVGLVRVVIGPSDTLATRVSITYRYAYGGEGFYHYPYQLGIL